MKTVFISIGFVIIMASNVACIRKSKTKPNIIFILTDDQRWDAMGYAGNSQIHTPEMDLLAEKGIYFKNAFVTTPICAASRASIMTGLYERTHGYTFEQGAIKDDFIENSYPALMMASNYYTGFFGKFGIDYDDVSSLFDISEVYDRQDKYKDYRGYYYKTIGKDTVHLTRYTGQKAIDFINNAPPDRPFCLSLSFSAPHAHDPSPEQYFWQEEVDHLYRDTIMSPPLLSEYKYFEELPDVVKKGINRSRWFWRYSTPKMYQHSIKGYYRMISGIDIEIGKIRRTLIEKGIAGNTIIILMGDNGYFEGERQLAGKWLMYDNSLRVPMIIFDPRSDVHKDITDLVLNIDIPSTILEYAGLNIPVSWQGISLAGYSKGRMPAVARKDFLCEHLWDVDKIPSSEGIRTKEWKYFRYHAAPAPEELYHISEDPNEINNLAGNKEYRDILNHLRYRMDSLLLHIKKQ
jgi:arylsulfatase A-like enzyme